MADIACHMYSTALPKGRLQFFKKDLLGMVRKFNFEGAFLWGFNFYEGGGHKIFGVMIKVNEVCVSMC